MTTEEICDKNENIHRFMGHRVEDGWCYLWDGFNTRFQSSILKYNTSWDELMPVVEKISITAHVDIKIQKAGGCSIWVDGVMIAGAYNGTTIEQVYSCVERYITWHNAQNKTL